MKQASDRGYELFFVFLLGCGTIYFAIGNPDLARRIFSIIGKTSISTAVTVVVSSGFLVALTVASIAALIIAKLLSLIDALLYHAARWCLYTTLWLIVKMRIWKLWKALWDIFCSVGVRLGLGNMIDRFATKLQKRSTKLTKEFTEAIPDPTDIDPEFFDEDEEMKED